MDLIDSALKGFMSSRCNVSSQHKLPSREEVLGTVWASYFDAADVSARIDAALADGSFIAYGPYISDRRIDVL